MTHKNFSFWFCTLLSGVVIGIASQRIPEAGTNAPVTQLHPYSFYCDQSPLPSQSLSSLHIQKSGCSFSYDARHRKSK